MYSRDHHDHAGHEPHGHSHGPAGVASEHRLLAAALLTGGFMLAEVAGGLVAGSLALLADAAHMLTDFGSLALAYVGMRVARRPRDARRTYGYARTQVLAAFINGIALLALSVWICIEAAERLLSPVVVLSGPMLVVAVIGLAVNGVSFLLLHGASREDINVKGALVHVMGDLLGSAATIAAALTIWFSGWTPIDPILSVVVALLIVRSGWNVVRRAGHILLEGTPEEIDLDEIERSLANVPGVAQVSHIHVWSLTSGRRLATLHVRPAAGADSAALKRDVRRQLESRFGIEHATIEID